MSLRYVHIVFITLSLLLAVGFAIWALRDYKLTGDVVSLSFGIGSAVLILPILIYGRWFWRKTRGLITQAIIICLIPTANLFCPDTARACAVCAVDPNSLMAKGAFWGIAFLGIVIASVLTAIAVITFYWMYRARQLDGHV